MDEEALQRIAALLLIGAPLLVEPLQTLYRPPLRRVGDEAALREALLVDGNDIVRTPGHARGILSAAPVNSRAMLAQGTALVAEDDEQLAFILRFILEREGFEV